MLRSWVDSHAVKISQYNPFLTRESPLRHLNKIGGKVKVDYLKLTSL